MKKRILIDCTCINSKMDGLSQYAINIIKCLLELNSGVAQYSILLRDKQHVILFDSHKEHLDFKVIKIAPIGLLRDIKLSVYLYMRKHEYDLVYFISNQYPILFRGGIYTIHDVIYESFPEQLGRFAWFKKIYLHINVKWGIYFSDSIITVSNFTKDDVIKYHRPPQRIQNKMNVIYEGWEHMKVALSTSLIDVPFKKYLFYVGSSRGHKNITRLLKAYSSIVDQLPSEWGLVIVGEMHRLGKIDKMIIEELNNTTPKIHLTGWISDEQLALLFKRSNAFIFPSLSEGFGIPILESFYWEVPILCSNNTVFPEIAKNAALYFNPLDIEDIADKILDFVFKYDYYKQTLIPNGKKMLENYSWLKSAKHISSIIKSLI